MPGLIRRRIHPFVPAGFQDPVGLARRLVRSGDPAARFAMRTAALGPLLIPLDLLMAPFEAARRRRAGTPERPIVLVCGPARSGTTLTAQLLMRNLPVIYLDNLVASFPRAPLTARATLGRFVKRREIAYHSFYGRTDGWSAPSDALNLWDRWLGHDRGRVPREIGPAARRDMVSFFGSLEGQTRLPVVLKNNALNVSAHLVADALPSARFICLQRERTSLALSLLKAQSDIHGEPGRPYGLMPSDERTGDPVEDVCRQILFHEAVASEQVGRLGPERFRVIRFEDVLGDPRGFIERTGRELLGVVPNFTLTDPELGPLPPPRRPRDAELVERIEGIFARGRL